MKKNRKFTLIELFIAITVIAILIGMLLPALKAARDKAQSITCLNNLKTYGTNFMMYINDYNLAPAVQGTDSSGNPGLLERKLIGFDRSLTPSAASTSVTAWCIDGLPPLATKDIKGAVQSLFSNGKRHTWSVFNNAAVPGNRILDLTAIPRNCTVLNPMGNDPRKDGLTRRKIGIIPLFVMTEHGSADQFAEMLGKAVVRETFAQKN